MKKEYQTPSVEPIGGGDVQPMSVLTFPIYVVAIAVWEFVAAFNAGIAFMVAWKTVGVWSVLGPVSQNK